MGVDISGKKPKTELGDYFQSNWWGWRPINYMCQLAAEQSKLKIDFSYWGSNDGKGLNTQKQCDKLATALETLLGKDIDVKDGDERVYLVLGSWCEAGTGRMLDSETTHLLNQQYEYGTIVYTTIIASNGIMVEPAHSTSINRIKEFIEFLKNCGGFQIW